MLELDLHVTLTITRELNKVHSENFFIQENQQNYMVVAKWWLTAILLRLGKKPQPVTHDDSWWKKHEKINAWW